MTRTSWTLVIAFVALVTISGPAARAETTQGSVTFADDVAALLYEHCVTCHRPDGVGPFSLLTYDDAAARTDALADATARRFMPPWKPVDGHAGFLGARGLTSDEIDVFRRWADSDAPEGNLADAPAAPTFPAGWQLGEPDLVVALDEPYQLDAASPGTSDIYRNFVLPMSLTERRWVRAVDVRPEASGIVHHARVLLDATGNARVADDEDPAPGYDGLIEDHGAFPRGHALDWAPGRSLIAPPASMAWPLGPGADVVLRVHLRLGSEPTTIQPEVGFYFAEEPADVVSVSVLLAYRIVDIPAGEADKSVEDRFRLPVAADLHAIAPFARNVARKVKSRAILPDGGELTLLQIDDWDYDWLNEYRFAEPLHLPAGTVVTMELTFDNSTGNPRNPSTPPQVVRFGLTSRDEQPELRLQVVPTAASDLTTLQRSATAKSARDHILGYQARLRDEPTDHITMTNLALRYLQVGEFEAAVEQLQTATRLAPDYAHAQYALGTTFITVGKMDEATTAFSRVVEIEPRHAGAHQNLGVLMESAGNIIDAEAHYRLAAQFDPRSADTRYNLARLAEHKGNSAEAEAHLEVALQLRPYDAEILTSMGHTQVRLRQYASAVEYYQRALNVEPNFAECLVWLSWIRATAPVRSLRNGLEAVQLAEQAASLVKEKSAFLLDVLAAAYAADGRFDLAVSTATEAATLARAQPEGEDFASRIEARSNLYLAFTPYRMPLPDPPQ